VKGWVPERKIEDFVASFIIEAEKGPKLKDEGSCNCSVGKKSYC